MTTTADKSVLVSPSERARIARQEPSLANRILLLEFAEAPADLPGALVAKGYFKLYCTYRPLTWDSLASKTFQPAFKNGIVDIRGQNLRGQDLDSNLVYRFVGAAKHPFVTALHEFFYTKFRNFFKYDPAGLLPAMEVHVFKFAPKMCFRSHFFDSLKPMENGVPAYRIIWFSHHVKVIFSKFAGADFLSQQKTLFDSIITCENDVHVFGFAAYGQKCGKAGVVDLQANEVLLLPAPCVFKVETGLPQIIMCTSLLLSKGNKASGKGVGGLQLCTTAGAVKSSAPFGAKPLFASFTPNQQLAVNECMQKSNNLRNRRKPPLFEVSKAKVVIWPQSAETIQLDDSRRDGNEETSSPRTGGEAAVAVRKVLFNAQGNSPIRDDTHKDSPVAGNEGDTVASKAGLGIVENEKSKENEESDREMEVEGAEPTPSAAVHPKESTPDGNDEINTGDNTGDTPNTVVDEDSTGQASPEKKKPRTK